MMQLTAKKKSRADCVIRWIDSICTVFRVPLSNCRSNDACHGAADDPLRQSHGRRVRKTQKEAFSSPEKLFQHLKIKLLLVLCSFRDFLLFNV